MVKRCALDSSTIPVEFDRRTDRKFFIGTIMSMLVAFYIDCVTPENSVPDSVLDIALINISATPLLTSHVPVNMLPSSPATPPSQQLPGVVEVVVWQTLHISCPVIRYQPLSVLLATLVFFLPSTWNANSNDVSGFRKLPLHFIPLLCQFIHLFVLSLLPHTV